MKSKKRSFIIPIFLTIAVIGTLAYGISPVSAAECSTQIAGKSRAQLEAELEACNQEIAQWTAELNKTKQESASFARDVSALTAKINAAQANIRGKNIAINNLSKDISTKQAQISDLDQRIIEGKRAIAAVLRKTNEINSYSLVEALLSNKNFSEFFVDIDTYASTGRALDELLAELGSTRSLTEAQKAELARKRDAEAAARAALEASKKVVEISQREKQTLLSASQTKEKTYEQVVADRKAKAEQIKAVLFPLRDAGPIPFGTALQYAQNASSKTGVSPALILAILQQESALGANVGSCIITDLNSGQTKGVVGRVNGVIFSNGIHPTRDLPLVQSLIGSLGRDPLSTRISCPISSTFGYGGAMGPAQFIPSTWRIIIPSLRSATGKTTPDPWDPADAIMAAALLLRDNGAASGTYVNERTAACKYYSGRNCYNSDGSAGPGLSYGNQVMNRVAKIQADMNLLAGI